MFVLAHHGPGTTAFRPVAMPLDFILGPGLASGPPEAVERAVRALFGSTSPVLAVRALNAAGKVRRKGSWSLLPLLADFQYTSSDAYLVGRMNDRLLDYLPQLLELPLSRASPAMARAAKSA